MRRHSDTNVIREQSSIFYFSPRESGSPRVFTELYTKMFIEDVSLGLAPIFSSVPDSKIDAYIFPENSKLERQLCSALNASGERHYSRGLGRTVSQFLRLLMRDLCNADHAMFEIAYLRPNSDAPRDNFELVHLNSQQIFYRWNCWYQSVPAEIAQEQNVAEQIALPSENIVTFSLPTHLKNNIRKAMMALSAVSNHDWHNLAVKAHSEKFPYEFSTHHRSKNLAIAESMKEIGWTARGLLTESVTNYYSVRQTLQFKLFLLEVRESLLDQLNAALEHVGKNLGWLCRIYIGGLPSRRDLEKALTQLSSGERPFTEIMNDFRNL